MFSNPVARTVMCVILSILPLGVLIQMVAVTAVNLPFMDEWSIAALLEYSHRGTLTFGDFWQQQNEHRVLFPKLILYACAKLTHWNTNFEAWLNVLAGIGIFLVLLFLILSTSRMIKRSGVIWAIPATSLIVFSLAQFHNYIFGWQITFTLGMLASLFGITMLSKPEFKSRQFGMALAAGVVSLYTFGGGLIYWGVGALALSFMPKREGENRKLSIALFLIVGLASIGLYLHGYRTPTNHTSISYCLHHLGDFSAYIFEYLGAPCAQYSQSLSLILGIFGFAATLIASWILIRREKVDKTILFLILE